MVRSEKEFGIDEELYDYILWILQFQCNQYQQEYNNDFRRVLDACLSQYLRLVKIAIEDPALLGEVSINCNYMKLIVKSFMQGRHSKAYSQLKNVLKRNGDLYVTEIKAGELFYRMRTAEKRRGLSRTDLFHIPMTQKRIIKTQRYSAPGYPCLYLGKSIYGCWEEMQRPHTETTLVSCFKTQDKFNVLDLRIPTLEEFLLHHEKYLRLFPFIIACGIPVRDSEDVFKPEYIVSQLFLEWTIENNSTRKNSIIGVYYTSANRNEDFYVELDHEWDNLAIPVQDALSSDEYCPKLKELFHCTRPTCYEYELIQGNINTTGHWDNGPKRKDPEGWKDDYYLSVFSRMEELLEKRTFDVVDTEELD